MKSSEKTIEEIRLKFQEMDGLLHRLEAGLSEIEQFSKSFDIIDQIDKEIQRYYRSDWDSDVTKFHEHTDREHYNCSNQDSIWNATQELYDKKIKLLKKIMTSI